MNYNKINQLFRNSDFAKMEFYEKIGISATGYRQMMENKSLKVETLEKIAAYFDKPIGYFFDITEDVQKKLSPEDLRNKVDELYEENRTLMKENSQLKDQIRSLEKNSNITTNTGVRKLEKK